MKKILIIEDTFSLRDHISFVLTLEGFEVLQADNGEEGIEKAIHFNPDLILCDILMPGISGYEVFKKLQTFNSERRIPFVFITALSERKNFRAGMELGADDYLVKPFTIEELLNAIKTQLNKYNTLELKISNQMLEIENSFNQRYFELKAKSENQEKIIHKITVSHKKISHLLHEKQAQLMNEALRSIDVNSTLKEITEHLKTELLKKGISDDYRDILTKLRNRVRKKSILLNNWSLFQLNFDLIYPEITSILITKFPHLTQHDRLILSAIYTNLDSSQLAAMLNVLPSSIRKYRFRLKKKLGLNQQEDILSFIYNLSFEQNKNPVS